MEFNKSLLSAALKQDFLFFSKKAFKELHGGEELELNWHHELITSIIEDVYYGRSKRVIITLPPRYLKSFLISVAAPAWILGNDSAKQILCVSYSETLANSLSEKCKQLMECEWYKTAFGTVINPKRTNTKSEYTTRKGGGRYATSTGGTITGIGGNIIIIDDPIKAKDAGYIKKINDCIIWLGGTLYPRMNDKKEDAIIIVMQRLHEDDLAGYVQTLEKWKVIDIPAIATDDMTYRFGDNKEYKRYKGDILHEAREGQKELDIIKETLGSMYFEAQYQQSPMPDKGNIFKKEWFIHSNDRPETFEAVVQSWDTASEIGDANDYSVCTTWGIKDRKAYLLNVFRAKLLFPALYKKAIELRNLYNADLLLIEKASSGPALIQQLKVDGIKAIAINPQEECKEQRAWGVTAKFEGGHVIFPESTTWMQEYLKEMLAFPNARHDDQVDSTTQFLKWFSHRRRQRKSGRRKSTGRLQGFVRRINARKPRNDSW